MRMNGLRLFAAVMAGALLGVLLGASPRAYAQTAPVPAVPGSQAEIRLTFAPLVKRTAPAVVNVFTKRTVRNAVSPLFNDPFFRRFFGDQFPGAQAGPESVQTALGSGVIVDGSGIIVTNNHVIQGADQITVVLSDRREFEAKLLRADERTDLAVLRIDPGKDRLPALEFRDSDELEVGDLVLAIGNPFGVGQTVTSGIVSAVARTNVGISDYRFFIQTDAAINPGNSGGALVSMDGRLVGINTAIFARDGGGSIGIGFAIPANMVKTVIANLNGDKIVRPWFGASGQNVTADIATSLGLPHPEGVLLTDVYPGGPAERAGLKRGDLVLQVDGRDVEDDEGLRYRIATHPVGSTMKVTALRDGQRQALPVALIAPPETPPRDLTAVRGNNPFAGVTVANLSPALIDELGQPTLPTRGVVVTELRRGSPAQLLRLTPGDVLVRVNDHEIKTVDDVRRVTTVPLPWKVVVRRGDRVLTLLVGG
jgi:Do/DeqQ family serine protease